MRSIASGPYIRNPPSDRARGSSRPSSSYRCIARTVLPTAFASSPTRINLRSSLVMHQPNAYVRFSCLTRLCWLGRTLSRSTLTFTCELVCGYESLVFTSDDVAVAIAIAVLAEEPRSSLGCLHGVAPFLRDVHRARLLPIVFVVASHGLSTGCRSGACSEARL